MQNILCIGSHPDDIEIGCGGLIASLDKTEYRCYYVTMSLCDFEGQENILDEQLQAMKILGFYDWFEGPKLPVRKLDTKTVEIRNYLYKIINELNPSLILTHSPFDIHTDHSTVGKQTVAMVRHKNVWCYEIIRSDSPEWQPNIYYRLELKDINKKIDALMKYESQTKRDWYNRDNFFNWARMRGIQAGADFAEVFWSPRICLNTLSSF